MTSEGTQINLITNEIEPKRDRKFVLGAHRKSIEESNSPFQNPITGETTTAAVTQESTSPKNSWGRKAGKFHDGSAAKQGFNIINNSHSTEKVEAPKRETEAPKPEIGEIAAGKPKLAKKELVNPVTGEQDGKSTSGPNVVGTFKRQMKEMHSDINPITGEKVERKLVKSTSGKIKKETEEVNSNVNPVTGEKKAPITSPPAKKKKEEEEPKPAPRKSTSGTFKNEIRDQGKVPINIINNQEVAHKDRR